MSEVPALPVAGCSSKTEGTWGFLGEESGISAQVAVRNAEWERSHSEEGSRGGVRALAVDEDLDGEAQESGARASSPWGGHQAW